MQSLTTLFTQEREGFFKPTPDFCERVMFRLAQQAPPRETTWDTILATTRPVLAAAAACFLILFGMDVMIPVEPSRGATQIFLESELNPDEALLYLAPEIPPADIVFRELIPMDGP